eukprot:TRINITY_DN1275_c0_g1_i9.p1 TRINITY_DN1275_c0_g1~~TRINITY_DN1275_c0_g1_i9.p1  ORF type:complete len:1338 (+),score=500.54 TRINITY_DN1275_c0_g1_i9:101-4114(+)
MKSDKLIRSPEDDSSWLSYVTFNWLTPLFKIGKEKSLDHEDLFPLAEQDHAETVASTFEYHWNNEVAHKSAENKKPTLVMTIWNFVRIRFFIAAIFKFVHDWARFGVPFCLSLILKSIEDDREDEKWQGIAKGYWYALALFGCQLVQFFFVNQYFHIMFRLGMQTRTGIINLLFKNSLKLSASSKQQSSTGKIVNLMSNDATRINNLFRIVQNAWSAPFQLVIGFGMLYFFLGWSGFSGVALMFILSPIQTKMMKKLVKTRKRVVGFTDARVKIVNELMAGIRVIKYYAWEKPFGKQVADSRRTEINQYSTYVIIQAINYVLWRSSIVFVTLLTFTIHASFGGEMKVSTIFTAIAIFNRIRFPISMISTVITNVTEAHVSMNRIANYLISADNNKDSSTKNSMSNKEPSITIKDGSFTWNSDVIDMEKKGGSIKGNVKDKKKNIEEASLASHKLENVAPLNTDFSFKNLNFKANQNELVAVVGAVGCGKSSLISAILGEMSREAGELNISGSIAYVPQQAWIINTTLKNNVLFGEELDEIRYKNALKVAQLETDLEKLPNGDETEIGERGINLSGGQKQRVSLARAIYANKDIYVFDDPLSALDAHVGRAVFEQLINNHLKNKLVVLVTHQLQFLTQCDRIYVLKDGGIDSEGTFQELMIADGELRRLCDEHGIDVNETLRKTDETEITTIDAASGDESVDESEVVLESKSEDKIENKSDKEKGKEKGKGKNKKGKLVQKEERGRGSVKKSTYISYFRMFWRWKGAFILFAIYILLNGLSRVSPDFFLTYWSTNEDEHSVEFFLMIFAILNIVYVFMQFGLTWMFMVGSLNASTRLHDGLLASILRAPVKFFDVTPVGRVLNRFTKDVDLADQSLRETMHTFVVTLVQIITSVSIIMLITRGLFLVPIILLSYIYATIMQYYRCSCRELKRLDSVSKSPIFSNFSETLGGLTTIRAFSKEEHVIRQNHKRLDYNCTAMFLRLAANRWLSLRLESLGAVLTLSTSSLLVFLRSQTSVSAGLVGFALVYTIQLMTFLSWMVRQVADTEAQMNAVERLKEYQNDEFEHEAPAIMDNDKKIVKEDKWISDGKVEFEDYSMRYRPELDLVLKNVSMKIPGKSKVGICGRTGSGKSSLMVALFRMTEASGGKIIIDDEDISKIGLETLRSSLAIIPQDPVLFVGSVRMNLDPFNNFSDDELWEALRRCHMKDVILSRNNALDADVTEGGENFSVGERQLLCLGRALLRHAKVIVMDEATASVDFDTDSVIQETVRKEFSDSTVLTIAHRLPTIIDYDLILVMDDGKVAEFDKPKNLVSSGGIFSQLIDELGPAMAASMREQAQ